MTEIRLCDLLDCDELQREMEAGYITMRRHPNLPLAILNYTNSAMFDNHWSEVVQMCRGLIIYCDANHYPCAYCRVISRPFHKFFNLNQTDETKESHLLTLGEPTITEKMDGWFGIMWSLKDCEGAYHYGVASRGSFTSTGAEFATQKLQKLVKYGAVEEFPEGYSPIFEIIFKEGKIVVDYPFEGLVLLGCVNNATGEELSYDQLQAVWSRIAGYSADNRPWIRLVKAHRMSIDDCLVSDKKNFEGFVVSYARPGMYPIKAKVKLEDYKRLHRLITGVTPQQIWDTIHDPMAPWLGGNVPSHFRSWATKWRDELYSAFDKEYQKVVKIFIDPTLNLASADLSNSADRKKIVEILKAHNSDLAPLVMCMVNGQSYGVHQAVWDRIRPVGRITETFYKEGQGE